jgi:hypothetical protein
MTLGEAARELKAAFVAEDDISEDHIWLQFAGLPQRLGNV